MEPNIEGFRSRSVSAPNLTSLIFSEVFHTFVGITVLVKHENDVFVSNYENLEPLFSLGVVLKVLVDGIEDTEHMWSCWYPSMLFWKLAPSPGRFRGSGRVSSRWIIFWLPCPSFDGYIHDFLGAVLVGNGSKGRNSFARPR